MSVFGGRSLTVLKTLHPLLASVMSETIKTYDFMLIQGSRSREEQEADFRKSTTKAHWLQSAHDFNPSFGVDATPFPLNWSDIGEFRVMAAHVKQAAQKLNVPIVWGGDWHSIKDFPHFELTNWRELAKAK